ncbi:hypothetical protein MKW98_027445 [Papaver atlanticum]|uniref:Uncharacterized protein n=1 Tax=Papaver atlanticum TaxID=357466 RepID=A0AAD4XUE8_9MAGN|nr:hypothetical protein MKW98_027445 [Papaver atlanticum]
MHKTNFGHNSVISCFLFIFFFEEEPVQKKSRLNISYGSDVVKVKDDKDEFPTYVAMLAAQDDATRCKVFVLVVYFGSLDYSYLNIGHN